jgi:hypothetical protein
MDGFSQGAKPSNRPDSPFIALGREFGFETNSSLVLALKLFKSIGCTVQQYATANSGIPNIVSQGTKPKNASIHTWYLTTKFTYKKRS